MTVKPSVLSTAQIQAQRDAYPGWELRGIHLVRSIKTAGFGDAVSLLNRVAQVAQARDHHPDLQLNGGLLTLRVTTHDDGGITQADVDLCRALNPVLDAAAL